MEHFRDSKTLLKNPSLLTRIDLVDRAAASHPSSAFRRRQKRQSTERALHAWSFGDQFGRHRRLHPQPLRHRHVVVNWGRIFGTGSVRRLQIPASPSSLLRGGEQSAPKTLPVALALRLR